MALRVEDITINYEEDGVLVVKELDKVVLSKGSWSTILFKYQQWEKNKNEYVSKPDISQRSRSCRI